MQYEIKMTQSRSKIIVVKTRKETSYTRNNMTITIICCERVTGQLQVSQRQKQNVSDR